MKKIKLLSLLALTLPVMATAQAEEIIHASLVLANDNPKVIRLWPGETVSTEFVNQHGRICNINVPTLTAYFPKQKGNGTAVVVCPGGAYSVCGFHDHGTRLAELLNQEGIVVFVLKYRLKPPSVNAVADALADGLRAVQVVRSRAGEFGINSQRIGMVGYSAGANLTIHVASEFTAGDPGSTDPIERVSSRPDFIGLLCSWAGSGGTSCPYPLCKDSPPTFICHSKDDKVAPVSVAESIVAQLKQLNVPVELHLFETGGHANFDPGGKSSGGRWPELFVVWLRNTLSR